MFSFPPAPPFGISATYLGVRVTVMLSSDISGNEQTQSVVGVLFRCAMEEVSLHCLH
jgi:hypothetical protein